MKTLLIREVPDAVHDSLIAAAEKNRRSKEKQALHLIETALADGTAETCGELLDYYATQPAPNVDADQIEAFLAARGRRSTRP